MKNLSYINSSVHSKIAHELSTIIDKNKGCHFTNGTYAYSANLITPTILAGFKHVTKTQEMGRSFTLMKA